MTGLHGGRNTGQISHRCHHDCSPKAMAKGQQQRSCQSEFFLFYKILFEGRTLRGGDPDPANAAAG
jgi:hypothetical protein